MEASAIVDHLEGKLKTMAAERAGVGDVAALLRYLSGIRQSLPASVELVRLDSQLRVEQYKAVELHSIEMFRSVIEAGGEALRSIVLISGGGVVALMGFIGAALSRAGAAPPLTCLVVALALVGYVLFGYGVCLAHAAFAAYFAKP